ncbi:MAG: DUF1801 domain-containing protein [Bacteroidota bacterium]
MFEPPKPKNVDEYISQFPVETQIYLEQIRKVIIKNAPDTIEALAYGMPCYKTHGRPLVYFAGHANHIGLYATPSAQIKFKQELTNYKQGKGSVQFQLKDKLPIDLIIEIVKFRVIENTEKYKKK